MKPNERLDAALAQATADSTGVAIKSADAFARIEKVCRYPYNRTPVRILLACVLAKLDNPALDPRKPYTQIGTSDSFSGRSQYDEPFVGPFITKHHLPCNPTTGFLTPAVRTKNLPLSVDVEIVGSPRWLYKDTIRILTDVAEGALEAQAVLIDAIRVLVRLKEEREQELDATKASLRGTVGLLPPSSEDIAMLIDQHLKCKRSSRLPVLIVAAVYRSVSDQLGEQIRPLTAHTAADEQTGAVGDIEVTLRSETAVCTVYEVKGRAVTRADIDRGVQKVVKLPCRPDNYIFVTTKQIDREIHEYTATLYDETGIEFAVLDCLGFLRYFLHLFHRRRIAFLDAYQALVESDNHVGHELKVTFLNLRRSAQGPNEPEEPIGPSGDGE